MAVITYRDVKGFELTHEQLDDNWRAFERATNTPPVVVQTKFHISGVTIYFLVDCTDCNMNGLLPFANQTANKVLVLYKFLEDADRNVWSYSSELKTIGDFTFLSQYVDSSVTGANETITATFAHEVDKISTLLNLGQINNPAYIDTGDSTTTNFITDNNIPIGTLLLIEEADLTWTEYATISSSIAYWKYNIIDIFGDNSIYAFYKFEGNTNDELGGADAGSLSGYSSPKYNSNAGQANQQNNFGWSNLLLPTTGAFTVTGWYRFVSQEGPTPGGTDNGTNKALFGLTKGVHPLNIAAGGGAPFIGRYMGHYVFPYGSIDIQTLAQLTVRNSDGWETVSNDTGPITNGWRFCCWQFDGIDYYRHWLLGYYYDVYRHTVTDTTRMSHLSMGEYNSYDAGHNFVFDVDHIRIFTKEISENERLILLDENIGEYHTDVAGANLATPPKKAQNRNTMTFPQMTYEFEPGKTVTMPIVNIDTSTREVTYLDLYFSKTAHTLKLSSNNTHVTSTSVEVDGSEVL